MAPRGKALLTAAGWGLAAVVAAVGVFFAFPALKAWWTGEKGEGGREGPAVASSHELVRDAHGRPVVPYTIRLAPEVLTALKVTRERVNRAGALSLPPQIGTLGYDTDRLYAVRPRFQGEIIRIAGVWEYQRPAGSSGGQWKKRLLGPGDWVEQGKVLAVAWSKELGDRKVALVEHLLDLYVDQETLRQQEPAYLRGSLPPATYRASVAKVEKDLTAVYAAESGLGISRLTPGEIEEIRGEAKIIQKRMRGKEETPELRKARLTEDVQKWAKVAIVAPQTGVIVEKNTNTNDIVDPSRETPLFRIADLSGLQINVNFNEEYLPLLQPLMGPQGAAVTGSPEWYVPFWRHLRLLTAPKGAGELRWTVRIEAEPDLPTLDLPVLRIAPSLDPNAHTAVVIGRIDNPIKDRRGVAKRLLVGQFVTATVAVPSGPDVVDIPTNALNEVNGESLVLVQPNPDRPEYVLRRVAVVRRSRDVTQVRSKLTAHDLEVSAEEVREGRRPIAALQRGELLLTRGVTEITDAFEALIAKARAGN